MPEPYCSHALDHVVVVLFENRSLDNVLGQLQGPDDGKTSEGVVGAALSTLGKGMGPALVAKAREMGVTLPAQLRDPDAHLTPELVVPFLRDVAHHLFPLLGGTTT